MSAPRGLPCREILLYVTLVLFMFGRFQHPASAAAASAHSFRAQDWDLAWRAFIGAGKIEDAYALSRKAVAARPRSRVWLARLAEVARWSNHPQVALEALCRLALDLHDTSKLQPALELAIGLGDDDRAIELLRELIRLGRATPAQRQMLSGLYEDTGEPVQAIRELQREFARHPAPQLLWEQAVIQRTMGDPADELATLQRYRRRFGPGPRVMLAIATIEYVQGRLPTALEALLAARSRVRATDTAYWQTLSGLAWLLGRYRLAARAAQVLIDSNEADAPIYQRVVYAEQYRHPEMAFAIAERGWLQTHAPSLFLSMLAVASSLHPARPWLTRAFALLGAPQAAAFADEPFYWTSLAALRADEGRSRAALAAYRRALRLRPSDKSLLAGYLWLLIDSGGLTPIASELPWLASRAGDTPELWAPLAAAYQALGQPERALMWMQAQWSTRKNDPLWLIDYADTLEQTDRPEVAWQLRRRAYGLLVRGAAPSGKQTQQRLRILARLAISLAPGDSARRAIERLARQPDSRAARLTVLAWMLSERAYPLARWWNLRVFLRHPPPDWAQLAQAEAAHDGPAIVRLLGRPHARLSDRERVAAATDLRWDSLAVDLAYQGLESEPNDAPLQQQFEELAVPRADTLGAAATTTEWSGLLSEGVSVQASPWLSPLNRLDIRLDTLQQRVVDRTQLAYAPSLSHAAVLAWQHSTELGSLTFDLGAGRNLAAWAREGIGWQSRWSSMLETTLSATAGARPLDTAALSIAGLEDRVDAGARARLTARTTMELDLQAGRLRAQGGGTLGAVQRFSLEGDYQLWLSRPEFTLDASVNGAHYERDGQLPVQLLSLVPAGQRQAVAFFVPESYVQACGGGHFDLQYQTDYTPQFRPYAAADLCANSVSGRGYDLAAGIATPVFGADHLSLSLNLENNVGTHSGRTTEALLRYRHYFTPTH
ncbi:MAG: tetratricopeptide repeat protein [Steroidobacteraceae bacterium]